MFKAFIVFKIRREKSPEEKKLSQLLDLENYLF